MNKFISFMLFANISKDDYKRCETELIRKNYYSLYVFAVISVVFFGTCALLGIFIPSMQTKIISYLISAGVSLLAIIINLLYGKNRYGSLISIFTLEIGLIIGGLLITLVDAPEQLTVTLVPVLIIVPLLFTIMPWRTNILMLGFTVSYLIAAPILKPHDILSLDIVDVVVFSIIGVIIGNFVVRGNINAILAKRKAEEARQQSLDILGSFSGLFFSMSYIDIEKNLITNFSQEDGFNMDKLTNNASDEINSIVTNYMDSRYHDELLNFVRFENVRGNLFGKTSIKIDSLSKSYGWLRLEFIVIDTDEDGIPLSVVFTTRSINDEKAKEEELILESTVDKLTGCYNRRAFDKDMNNFIISKESNCAYISFDVNGLKVVNDSKGHAAGDELLAGASAAMLSAFGKFGKVYRNGGDEFSAIVNADSNLLYNLIKNFHEELSSYHGVLIDNISVALGYVLASEDGVNSIEEVLRIADERMYKDKDIYYSHKRIDRRETKEALDTISVTYHKILKCNLTQDIFKVISYDGGDDPSVYSMLSDWLSRFADNGNISPHDIEIYRKRTKIDYLREYFKENDRYIIRYGRKFGNDYRDSIMEIVKAQDFTLDNMVVYLFVKPI